MNQQIKVHGLKELDAQLRKLESEVAAKQLRGALMTASKPMMDQMKADAPVRKPQNVPEGEPAERKTSLKNTIGRRGGYYRGDKTAKKFTETFAGNDAVAVVQVGAVKKGAWKAHFQEFGTDHHGPQPFIRPAAYSMWGDVVERFKKSLTRRLKRLQKKQS